MIWVRHFFVAIMAVSMAAIILCVLAVAALQVMMTRGPLELPQLASYAEDQINGRLTGEEISIGSVRLQSSEIGSANKISLTNVKLHSETGELLLAVPELRTRFSLIDLAQGTVSPKEIDVVGTELRLLREVDGRITLLRQTQLGDGQIGNDWLELLDKALVSAELSDLVSVEFVDTDVSVTDRLSGQEWSVSDSLLALKRDGQNITLRTEISFDAKSGDASSVIATASHVIGTHDVGLALQFANAQPADLADMVTALDWMRILDTRISGSLAANVLQSGEVTELSGVLDLGQGRVLQTPASLPIEFSNAKSYFEYDKETDRLGFTQLSVNTSSGTLTTEGYVSLERAEDKTVQSMAGQFRFSNILIDRPDVFAGPIELDAAALDVRIGFAPLAVEVGALTVLDGDSTYRVSGRSVAGEDFWRNAYNVDIDHVENDRILELWPLKAIHKTRKWTVENFYQGTARNFRGGLRSVGGKFKYAFNFDVDNVETRFMDTMPPVLNGSGYGTLTNQDLRVEVVTGHVIAGDDTKVDLAGSTFYIPDIQRRPPIGEIDIVATGGVRAGLHLLDVEKFQFISKAGLTPDVASGQATVRGRLTLPLAKGIKPSEAKFDFTAEVTEVSSDTLVKDHRLFSHDMTLHATHEGLEMTGPATLDDVPVYAKWTMGFGPKLKDGSRIEAEIGLSDENLRALGIHLPNGSISGEAPATVIVDIKKGQEPVYKVHSALVGAELKVPALQWRKGDSTKGELTLTGKFGKAPTVDSIMLTAPGLDAGGAISFRPDGSMKSLNLSELSAGEWLDSAATIQVNKGGSAQVSLNGGVMDLRNFDLGNDSGGDAGTGGAPIDIRLDRLTIMSGLALTNFSARLEPDNGLRGTFTGRVNGKTEISGRLFPQEHGTGFEIVSGDAGRVLASAGLLDNAYGGKMKVVIIPREGDGNYDGRLKFENTRIKNASGMANLLNAISLVGLLQQLEGEGIHFTNVEGEFLLRSNGMQLRKISATGPSMGMTLDGWYDSARKRVDFEGVVTPLYAVNGLFQRAFGPLFGRRKGEGLFSFTYRMRGPSDDPKVVVNPLSILTPGTFREIFRVNVPVPLDGDTVPTVKGTGEDQGPQDEASKEHVRLEPKRSDEEGRELR